ncbi:transposase [Zymomonas mobilis subsp. pomaceae]|uniref:transposase n=1 Tax=Zymomonas mobilis TaxID=542 RepID=UPI0021005B3F|nr:transposase [Zymomonas mobilis]MDX5949558.1 transposase [Zymomonas mobilis subsp. pomaceae]
MHACADGQGCPLGFEVTGGEVSDYSGFDTLVSPPVATQHLFLADKGYDGDRVREKLLFHRVMPIISPRSNLTKDISSYVFR